MNGSKNIQKTKVWTINAYRQGIHQQIGECQPRILPNHGLLIGVLLQ